MIPDICKQLSEPIGAALRQGIWIVAAGIGVIMVAAVLVAWGVW